MQNAKTYRLALESTVGAMTADEADAKKKLDDLVDKRVQLEKAIYEREHHAMTDVVGAADHRRLRTARKIDQIWLPKLTIYNNFSDVARFDRCMNCHQGMDKTAPGSAVDPLYPHAHREVLTLNTPAEAPAVLQEAKQDSDLAKIEEAYDKAARVKSMACSLAARVCSMRARPW